jgi:hypothetical protein
MNKIAKIMIKIYQKTKNYFTKRRASTFCEQTFGPKRESKRGKRMSNLETKQASQAIVPARNSNTLAGNPKTINTEKSQQGKKVS